MKHVLEQGTLTIFLEGELNSVTSDEAEKEIDAILGESDFDALAFDMERVTYVSSAGLRIFVRLMQRYQRLSLVRVPELVYSVLEMVGITQMLDVEKLEDGGSR